MSRPVPTPYRWQTSLHPSDLWQRRVRLSLAKTPSDSRSLIFLGLERTLAFAMLRLVLLVLGVLVRALGSRRDLIVDNVALRQQLAAYKARGRHPRIRAADRAFWVVLRQVWNRWSDALVIVKPDTVIRWHRGLGKETPGRRAAQPRPSSQATVVGLPRIGGLSRRYHWREAA